MNLIPVKTPKLLKGIFPKYIWNMPDDQKVIYLTFDDGPTPEITQWTLDLLKTYNAKATFFCIGNNIEKHAELFNQIIKEGHALGNHTFHHPKGWTTNADFYVAEVLKTQVLIDYHLLNSEFKTPNSNAHSSEVDQDQSLKIHLGPKATLEQDNNPTVPKRQIPIGQQLFRPPYGQITPNQGKRLLALGYKIVMWDILAFDWKDSISKEQCAKNVISKASSGSIIVFHDSIKASKRMKFALTKTLEHFSEQGYEFKSL